MEKLRKKGMVVRPIQISGRTIAKSFWGKSWCDHLESFSDYANRLPRGRTYTRNGSVCHLEVQEGLVKAHVSGTELYTVEIKVDGLAGTTWEQVKKDCGGQIGSMLELLKGRLSEQVMEVVCNRSDGLFPKPKEIHLDCSCPDWATMCKHVAAVLYGVGHRLDSEPELLFLLRGVKPEELIASELSFGADDGNDVLPDEELSELFGIELEFDVEKLADSSSEEGSFCLGADVATLRKQLGLSRAEFARRLGYSAASVRKWELLPDRKLSDKARAALEKLVGRSTKA